MAIDKVRIYMEQFGRAEDIMEFEVSSATVELAALALGVEEALIAKTMSFYTRDGDSCILVVMAGDRKIDNAKFKHQFGMKAKMLKGPDVEAMTGHAPGGVCPFANPENVKVYLDQSLKRFDKVYPAAGSANSAIGLTCEELFTCSGAEAWVDITKLQE